MITIIDYGLGNIRAFLNVYEKLSIPVKVARFPAEVENATKLILPGVGSFDYAMNQVGANNHTSSKPFSYADVSKYYNLNEDIFWDGKTLGWWLINALSEHGIGAKTAVGYGYMNPI